MARVFYDTAEALIYDPIAANRNGTRSALYAAGFRKIESASTLETFNEHIMRRPPDLAICESQGVEAELCQSIQALRQGLLAYNPFIVIIVTAWENTNSLVTRVLNSGADDLLLRPFSTTTLEARIRTQVERRKGFVITSDYIGPDRRRDKTRPPAIDLYHPPNSLSMKAKERITADEAAQRLDAELKVARKFLTGRKLHRDAFQVCVLWRLIQKSAAGQSPCGADLAKLREVTKSVARRARETEFEIAITWCDSILSALEGVELGVDRNASMHLLGHAALKLNAVFTPGKTQEEALAELDATVSMIQSRNEAQLAS